MKYRSHVSPIIYVVLACVVWTAPLLSQSGSDLRRAAGNGDLNRIRELVRAGVSVESPSSSGQTALYRAARNGEPAAVRLLLELGANANAREEDGWTPLHTAAKRGYTEIVRALLDGGADPELETDTGRTAWHTALVYDRYETANFFALQSDLPEELKAQIRSGDIVIGGHRSGLFVRLWWYEAESATSAGRLTRLRQPLGAEHPVQRIGNVELVNPDGRILQADETTTRTFQMNVPLEVTEERPVFVGYAIDLDQYHPYYVVYNRNSPALNAPIPSAIREAWLRDEPQFALSDARLQEVARNLKRGHSDYIALIHAVWNYVYTHMEYRSPPDRPNTAAQVLEWGSGRCGEFTRLTVALMRAVGIAARQVNASAASPEGPDERDHTWTEVYVPDFGWLPVQSQLPVPENQHYEMSFRNQYVESRGPDYRVHYSRDYDGVRRCRPYFGAGVFVPLAPEQRAGAIALLKRISVSRFYDAEHYFEQIASQPAELQPLLYWMMIATSNRSVAEAAARRFAELAAADSDIDYEDYYEFSPSIVQERLAQIRRPLATSRGGEQESER
ncbi:MAG: ankyrin repeat domain-containing protein [Spirochaetales bacterium]|nr:ankyrin repeat domain-containing protein [Spirochaetales bacterium]